MNELERLNDEIRNLKISCILITISLILQSIINIRQATLINFIISNTDKLISTDRGILDILNNIMIILDALF